MLHDKDAMQYSIKKLLINKNNERKTLNALIITFNSEGNIRTFRSMIAPLLSDTLCYENTLVAYYESYQDAQSTANDISSILHSYNNVIIEQPLFTPDWLSAFFSSYNFGIRSVTVEQNIISRDRVPDIVSRKNMEIAKNNQYEQKLHTARIASLAYTHVEMVDDLTGFIQANWRGFNTASQLRQVIQSLISLLMSSTKYADFLGLLPAQSTLFAMQQKAEYMLSQASPASAHKITSTAYTAFKERLDSVGLSTICVNCTQLLVSHLREVLLDLRPNSIPPGNDNDDHSIPASLIFTPFSGLDLSFYSSCDLNVQLYPDYIQQRVQNGDTYLDILAQSITNYFVFIMQLKHEHLFKSLLIEHSKVMDTAPFHEHWLRLVDESRPNT